MSPTNSATTQSRGNQAVPSRPILWTRLILWVYLLCCAGSLGSAYLMLARAGANELQVLKAGTLFYASKDPHSTDVVRWAKSELGIRTVDLLSPGAGAQVYHLTGERQAASPTLVLHRGENLTVAAGPFEVEDAFQLVTSHDAPLQRGQRALLVMAGLVGLACVFSAEVNAVAGFVAALGAVALAILQSHCLNCNVGGSPASALAPLFGSIYIGIGALLFTLPVLRRREAYIGFLVVSGLVPGVQALLLRQEPKLCMACLAITFASAVYFVACLKTLASNKLSGTASPVWFKWALPLVLVALTVRHSLVAFGAVATAKPEKHDFMVPRLVKTPLSHFVRLPFYAQPGVLYVVTRAGCNACAVAKNDLTQAKISWREVSICSSPSDQGCFGGVSDYITPMLLICDANGRIAFQRVWSQTIAR